MASRRYIIGVLGQKGGIAKTTLATNLAAAALVHGNRTLLVDLDPQGSAMGWLAQRAEGSQLKKLEGRAMPGTVLTAESLRQLAAGYDVVVLDGPAKSDSVTLAAAKFADVVLLPCRPGAFDLWAWNQTLTVIDKADRERRAERRPPTKRLAVLCCVRAQTRMATEARAVMAKEAPAKGTTLADATICERTAYVEAAAAGEAIVTWRDRAAATEVRALYRQVMEIGS